MYSPQDTTTSKGNISTPPTNMVMNKKRKLDEDEDDGNLGDDEKEMSGSECTYLKKKRQKLIPQRRLRHKKNLNHESSEDDVEKEIFSKPPTNIQCLWTKHNFFGTFIRKNIPKDSKNTSDPCDNIIDTTKQFTDQIPESSSAESSTEDDLTSYEFYKRKKLPQDICLQCEKNPKDSLFAHLRTGHQVFCYSCAKLWWRYHNKCPFCKERILEVLQILPC